MKIDKDQIIGLLRDKGDHQRADEAEHELPREVDHEEHSGLLDRFELDPQEVLGKLAGGKGLGGTLGKE